MKPSALFQLLGLHASKSDENYVIGKLIYIFQHWNTPVTPIYVLQLEATEISFWFQWYLDQALSLDHLWGMSWYASFHTHLIKQLSVWLTWVRGEACATSQAWILLNWDINTNLL